VRATDIARSMIARFGMVDELGQVSYETEAAPMLGVQGSWRPRGYGDETAAAIDRALKLLVAQAFDTATAVLAREIRRPARQATGRNCGAVTTRVGRVRRPHARNRTPDNTPRRRRA